MKLTGPDETITRARQLRGTMSLPERMLWRALRGRQTGLRFRRQHPAGPYVLDFYCHEARLCVEVDGAQHGFTSKQDLARDAWLMRLGVRTMRIAAHDVFRNLEGVVQHIVAEATAPSVGCADTSP
jgi:very-short-patch-repair endonuclease